MMTLCVSGLSATTTYESLIGLFSHYGPVHHLCLSVAEGNPTPGQFAQVRMDHDAASQARRLLDGTILDGYPISVSVVEPLEPAPA
ncbi:MAG: RNA-binding protein [Xanthomonadales bacterium]|nr:RNA-binding protein [Xanthomonadales bacterium]